MEITQQLSLPIFEKKQLRVHIKRLDLAHLPVSGNKYFKLKYNLDRASEEGHNTLLTFGGAYSNHILATALAGAGREMRTIGLIRGEELSENWRENPTLKAAAEAGMNFEFLTRTEYRNKNQPAFINTLNERFGRFYLLPEGGTNELAVKGCEDILEDEDMKFEHLCCAVGTGGTLAGLVNGSSENQMVLGFASLKGHLFQEDICKFTPGKNWKIFGDYHFGGYAKVNQELISFINNFRREAEIPLDPVYTGKMMFGVLDLIRKDYFKTGTSILMIHTGGLQGIDGMNAMLKKKNMPLIGL